MELIIEIPHEEYVSAIYIRPGLNISSAVLTELNKVENLTIRTSNFSVTSPSKHPAEDFVFNEADNFNYHDSKFFAGAKVLHGFTRLN